MNHIKHSPLSALLQLDERAKATQREIKDAAGKIIRQVARGAKQ